MRYSREITAAIASPIVIWLIGWSHPYVFDVVIALVAVLAMFEFLALGRAKGYKLPTVLCSIIMLIIISAFVLEPVSVEIGMFAALLIIPASYVFSRNSLEDSLPSSAIAVLATTYVGML